MLVYIEVGVNRLQQRGEGGLLEVRYDLALCEHAALRNGR